MTHRPLASNDDRRQATDKFNQHVTAIMTGHLARQRQLAEYQGKINASASEAIRSDSAAMAALKAMTPLLDGERRRFQESQKQKPLLGPARSL